MPTQGKLWPPGKSFARGKLQLIKRKHAIKMLNLLNVNKIIKANKD